MLSLLLSENYINITDEELGWKEAIMLGSKPLIENGCIEERYVEAMYEMALKHGAFFDIGKQIAIPHARSEMGVLKTGMSFLRVKKPVYLLDDPSHPIDIFIIIAAADNSSHLKALTSLSEILINDETVSTLKGLSSASEIAELFRKEDKE